MLTKLFFLIILIFSDVGACVAQSTMTYLLVVPPSATVAGSGCACDGPCAGPDDTWLTAGSYAAVDDCNPAITVRVIEKTFAGSCWMIEFNSQRGQEAPQTLRSESQREIFAIRGSALASTLLM
jgi:hypothetical protein